MQVRSRRRSARMEATESGCTRYGSPEEVEVGVLDVRLDLGLDVLEADHRRCPLPGPPVAAAGGADGAAGTGGSIAAVTAHPQPRPCGATAGGGGSLVLSL